MDRKRRHAGLALSAAGTVLQLSGAVAAGQATAGTTQALFLLGTVVLAAGLAWYSGSKGHSVAFCAAALLGLLGVVLVAALSDRARKARSTRRAVLAGTSVVGFAAAVLVAKAVSATLTGEFAGVDTCASVLLLCAGFRAARGSRAAMGWAMLLSGCSLCLGLTAALPLLPRSSQPASGDVALRVWAATRLLLSAWAVLNLVWLGQALRRGRRRAAAAPTNGTGTRSGHTVVLLVVGLSLAAVLGLLLLGVPGTADYLCPWNSSVPAPS